MPRSKRKPSSGGSFGRRVRGLPREGEPRRRGWPVTLAVFAIFFVALFVRFYGLSHDLDEGNVYHPDTPKQINAADRFLRGHYYFRVGNRDIDGYPYFNMHLVEYEWRGLAGVQSVLEYLMGWRREFAAPQDYADLRIKLFVLARISVCVMSALVVLVIYRLGRETWSAAVGLVAAGLAALSPLNVEIGHYAMSDSVMDLFVCLTVLCALRMYRSSRYIYPLLAGCLGAFAFASKYNGGIVLVFVALLHVLKYASPRRLFGLKAVRNAALLAVGVVLGLGVAIPSLLIYPDRVAKEIVSFWQYVANYRLTPEQAELTGWARASLFGSQNLATLVRCVGPLVMIAGVGGFVLSVFRRRRHVLVGLFPLIYLVISLVGKPRVVPYHFSVLVPFFCLYTAVMAGWLGGLRRLRVPGLVLASLLVGAALVIYVGQVIRIDFFFWHMDSRRTATAWVDENVPDVFGVSSLSYGLYPSRPHSDRHLEVIAVATGNLREGTRPPGETFELKRFHLEDKRPLTIFRNSGVTVFGLEDSAHLRADFSMPVYQRLPSETGNEFVFPQGAEFLRSGRFIWLKRRATRRLFVMPDAPEAVVIALRNGEAANVVTLSFGKQKHDVVLEPLETQVLTIENPKRMPLLRAPFYKFWARAAFPCQAEVAVTEEQKGVLYYNAAQYGEALPHLVAAWRERPGPTLAQLVAIAAACSGKDLDELKGGAAIRNGIRADLDRPSASLFERFGISSVYVDNLSYIDREAETFDRTRGAKLEKDVSAAGDTCVMPRAGDEEAWSVTLRDLFLEPGWYRVILRVRVGDAAPENAAMTVSFEDPTGRITFDSARVELRDAVGGEYRDVECSIEYADRLGPTTLRIGADSSIPLRLDRLVMAPDFERQVEGRDRLVRAILDENVADLEAAAQHFEPLLAYGNSAAGGGEEELALAAYRKAAEADPDSYRPSVAMRRILDRLPEELKAETAAGLDEVKASRVLPSRHDVAVRFKNGLELVGYSLGADEYAPGETIEMTLYWRVRPEDVPRYRGRALFIHFIPEGGPKDAIAFQGDTDLTQGLRFNERRDRIQPIFRHPVKVEGEIGPGGTREEILPGTYEIEVGILITMHQKRIRVLEADVPHTNNSATIGRVRVVPRRQSVGE